MSSKSFTTVSNQMKVFDGLNEFFSLHDWILNSHKPTLLLRSFDFALLYFWKLEKPLNLLIIKLLNFNTEYVCMKIKWSRRSHSQYLMKKQVVIIWSSKYLGEIFENNILTFLTNTSISFPCAEAVHQPTPTFKNQNRFK